MDITVGGNYSLMFSNLKKDFQTGVSEAKPTFKGLYQQVGSSTTNTVQTWLSFPPGMREWKEGTSRILRNLERYEFAVKNRMFEDTIQISVTEIEDDQFGVYGNRSKMMGAAAAALPDQLIAELLNNGFTTALGYDGLPWFSTSHTVGLSTVSNKGTKTLTRDSYATAYQQLMNYKIQADKDSVARPLNNNIGTPTLLVPPTLFQAAKEIVDVEDYGGTSTSFRISNMWNKTAKVLATPWITSSTAWYLIVTDGAQAPVMLQERTPLQFIDKTAINSDKVFMDNQLVFGCKWRGAAYPTHPWLAYGSTGAEA